MSSSHEAGARPESPVRPALAHEYPLLSDALSRAFLDDPVTSYLLPDSRTRYQAMLPFFRAEMRSTRGRGQVLTVDDLSGAALWFAPGHWRTGLWGAVKQAPLVVTSFRARTVRALRLLSQIERLHPEEPHWYLGILGTHPHQWGRGVGAALITEVTRRCDADGVGAYVESSKLDNVPYYERFGFRVTQELEVDGGPTIWRMWRDPEI